MAEINLDSIFCAHSDLEVVEIIFQKLQASPFDLTK